MNRIFLLLATLFLHVFPAPASKVPESRFALSRMNDSSIHFLKYLPHSGFSNQINELSNALLMARLLNRTLILPPFFLGERVTYPWKPFDRLNSTLSDAFRQFSSNLSHNFWTLLEVSEFFPQLADFKDVMAISYSNFKDRFPQPENLKSYILKDYTRYNYKYVVSDVDTNRNLTCTCEGNVTKIRVWMRIRKSMDLHIKYPISIAFGYRDDGALKNQHTPSILHVGSLFGQGRIDMALDREERIQEVFSHKKVISKLLSNPTIPCFDILESNSNPILGNGVYFSIHLRGKFPFSRYVKLVAKSSLDIFFGNGSLYAALEACLNRGGVKKDACSIFAHGLQDKKLISSNVSLFVATDMKKFSRSAERAILSKGFKNIITLEALMTDSTRKSILACLKARDAARPIPIDLLYPMFDQLMAARALVFTGTSDSTFSHFIHKIHLAQLESKFADN